MILKNSKSSGVNYRDCIVARNGQLSSYAATASEIATNLAIRNEFEARSKFDADFVGSMLVWANGLQGKVSRLLKPLYKGTPKAKKLAPPVYRHGADQQQAQRRGPLG
jgi:hypothetical protein